MQYANIYAASSASIASIIDTIALGVTELIEKDSVIVIVGDSNVNIAASNANSKLLQQFMQSLHMQEITNSVLEKAKPVIDRIWTNLQIERCQVQTSDAYWTDHGILDLIVHLV